MLIKLKQRHGDGDDCINDVRGGPVSVMVMVGDGDDVGDGDGQ